MKALEHININEALQFIKDHHNGEIPYTFGKNEYAKWMAEFAKHVAKRYARAALALQTRSEKISLLENFSTFLCANGYMDSDWMDEPPYAIDEFMRLIETE